MSKHLERLSLGRMLVLFVTLSVLLLTLTQVIVLGIQNRYVRDTTLQTMSAVFRDSVERAQKDMSTLTNMVQTTANRATIRSFCLAVPVDQFAMKDDVSILLQTLSDYMDEISGIALITSDGTHMLTEMSDVQQPARSAYYRLVREYDISGASAVRFINELPLELKDYFVLVVPVNDGKFLGVCAVLCSADALFARDLSARWPCLVIDKDDHVIFSNDTEFSGLYPFINDSHGIHMHRTEYQLLSDRLRNLDWTIYVAYSDAELNASIKSQLFYAIQMLLLIVLVDVLLALVLYRMMVNPIIAVAKSLSRIDSSAEVEIKSPVQSRNELVSLTSQINGLFHRLKALSDDVVRSNEMLYHTNIARLRAKVMFLQAQINPHFLYNNLQCIRGMAGQGDERAVSLMVNNMANLYRYCVRHQDKSTVAEELKCAQWYIDIMRLRYEEEIVFSACVDDAVVKCSLPCVTLQPLLENAFLHGFIGAKPAPWRLTIQSQAVPDGFEICIGDNGAGMSDDEISEANERLMDPPLDNDEDLSVRIGIYNVNSRLALLFGAGSGIHLARNTQGGINVTIRVINMANKQTNLPKIP